MVTELRKEYLAAEKFTTSTCNSISLSLFLSVIVGTKSSLFFETSIFQIIWGLQRD